MTNVVLWFKCVQDDPGVFVSSPVSDVTGHNSVVKETHTTYMVLNFVYISTVQSGSSSEKRAGY